MVAIKRRFDLRRVRDHYVIDVFSDLKKEDGAVREFERILNYIKRKGTDLVIINLSSDVHFFGFAAFATVLNYRRKIKDDGRQTRFRYCGNREPVLRVARAHRLGANLESGNFLVRSCRSCSVRNPDCPYRLLDDS